jgi:hypothetical protein
MNHRYKGGCDIEKKKILAIGVEKNEIIEKIF